MELFACTAFVLSVFKAPTCFIASTTEVSVLLVTVETGIIRFCTGELRGFGLPDEDRVLRARGGFVLTCVTVVSVFTNEFTTTLASGLISSDEDSAL